MSWTWTSVSAGVGRRRPVVMRARPGLVDLLPAACLHRADRGIAGSGGLAAEMHKPRYLADDDWTNAWGISWRTNRQDGVSWIQHTGGLPGFTTIVSFDPGQQVGVIV